MHFIIPVGLMIAAFYCSYQRLFMMLEIKGGLLWLQEGTGHNLRNTVYSNLQSIPRL